MQFPLRQSSPQQQKKKSFRMEKSPDSNALQIICE